jgi:methyl-accepting chemotaxis protein
MNTWSIPRRIALGFLALFLIALALGLLGLWQILSLQGNVETVASNSVPSVVTLNRMMQLNAQAARSVRRAIIDAAEGTRSGADVTNLFESFTGDMQKAISDYTSLVLDEKDHTLLRSSADASDRQFDACREALGLLQEGKVEAARVVLRDRIDPLGQECAAAFNAAVEYNADVAQQESESARRKVRQSYFIIGTALLAALALASVLGAAIVRATAGALRGIADALESNATQTATAAGQLSSVSQAFATGCSEQGSSVAQTSAALEEMSTMIRSTADNAAKAKDLANGARQAADSGAATMVAMNEAMSAIEASSAEVAKIVKNIDEIAFQTNILALNAAVEAARAGEAGAGFAVVADEVRSLAQRSAAAARETADKIETAIAKSRHGSASCGRVGESLGEIAEKVTAADNLVAEIATAAREQTHGIKQIGVAMNQMDSITRGNAARAEETASAAAELHSQAHLMQEGVDHLRRLLGGTAARTLPAPVAAASRPATRLPAPIRPAARRSPSLQAAAPICIPMPGDDAPPRDEEDRNFRNF